MLILSRLRWVLVPLAWAVCCCAAPSRAASPPLEVFAVSDAVRVFEDGVGNPDQRQAEMRMLGLRNEIVSAQCVVQAHEALSDVTVSVESLTQAASEATIPAENVRWNFVESIFIEENTPKVNRGDLIRAAPARFPDCLGEARQCSLAQGGLKAVYWTIAVPRDAAPGEYRAAVTVTCGSARASLPLVLTVFPLTLPDERHLMVTEWFSTSQFAKHHGIESLESERFFPMLRLYAQNMAEHRQNVFRVSLNLVRATRAAGGNLRFDFSEFDRWAQVFWDTGRMDLLETGFVAHHGEGGWSSREIRLSSFSVKDETTGKSEKLSGEEYLPQFLPALVDHLRQKEWLDKTIFHICDEPAGHNVMVWREASDFVHRHAPELRRVDAIETPHCLDRLEIWVPKLDHLATWQAAFEDAQRQGNELWLYTVGIFQGGSLPNKTVDVPLIDSRLLHWLNYRYALKGYLHWGFNAWTDDPINAPGKHRGDGWHVYPKPDGLLDSLRWEQMRNGIQDYECLWLLENKIAQIKATLSPRVADLIQPSRRGVEIASQVVRTYTDFDRNPDVLYAARRQAIEETLALDASPRMIIQTNPPERSAVANNCSIDVHGWAEPGTKITINGREVPVAADGLVVQETPPSREGTVVVEAENGQGRTTTVRKFRLQFEPAAKKSPARTD